MKMEKLSRIDASFVERLESYPTPVDVRKFLTAQKNVKKKIGNIILEPVKMLLTLLLILNVG